MFRFGWNNEEKEMISRTISELRELRTELSVLKDTLVKIMPEGQEPLGDVQAGKEAGGGLEEPSGELFGDSEEAVSGTMESETGCPAYDLDGEMLKLADCGIEPEARENGNILSALQGDEAGKEGQPEGYDSESPDEAVTGKNIPGPANKDWAVVNYKAKKKPWWKKRKPEDRIITRSV